MLSYPKLDVVTRFYDKQEPGLSKISLEPRAVVCGQLVIPTLPSLRLACRMSSFRSDRRPESDSAAAAAAASGVEVKSMHTLQLWIVSRGVDCMLTGPFASGGRI
jgi:hypothetical protein